jgi:hypothetical protein
VGSPECPGMPRMPTGAHIYISSMCMRISQNPSAGNDLTRLQKSIIDFNAGSAARRPSVLEIHRFHDLDGCNSGPVLWRISARHVHRCISAGEPRPDVYACTYRARVAFWLDCPPPEPLKQRSFPDAGGCNSEPERKSGLQ